MTFASFAPHFNEEANYIFDMSQSLDARPDHTSYGIGV